MSWRAWNITPESSPSRPVTGSAYTALHEAGWIVFETPDGREKRRLFPYPPEWATMSDTELLQLLVQASAVRRSKLSLSAASVDAVAETDVEMPAADAVADTVVSTAVDFRVVRSFRYPSGRLWTVRVARADGHDALVLRFSAGMRHLDLENWPHDWADRSTDGLIELLRCVKRPQPPEPLTNVSPGRRHSDRFD